MLTLRELRIEDMEKNDGVKMIKSQEKRMEVCRVLLTMNGPPKLILTKPLCVSNAMPYKHGHISNIKTLIPLLQVE
jgi:ABC-type lipopolysaccharide export system ATPase subunit